jgi:hypothetical protein
MGRINSFIPVARSIIFSANPDKVCEWFDQYGLSHGNSDMRILEIIVNKFLINSKINLNNFIKNEKFISL